MEPTSNFLRALEFAHNKRSAMPVYSTVPGDANEHSFLVGQLIRQPLRTPKHRRHEVVNTAEAVHRAARRLYIRRTWRIGAIFRGLDWTQLVDWLVEHWDDILRIILTILPLFL